MNPESPCRSVVSPMPKLLEVQYALRLLVVPCIYLPSPLPFFQSISPSSSSQISSVSVLHLLRRHIHPCCPASPPPCSPAAVFTSDLVCHPHYTAYPLRLHCHHPVSLLRYSSHYLPSSCVFLRRCLSTFSDRISSLLYIFLYYTDWYATTHTTFLTLRSDLLTMILFYFFARLFSLSAMFLLRSNLPRFSPLAFTPLCSNLTIYLRSICSYLLAPSIICSTIIAPLML